MALGAPARARGGRCRRSSPSRAAGSRGRSGRARAHAPAYRRWASARVGFHGRERSALSLAHPVHRPRDLPPGGARTRSIATARPARSSRCSARSSRSPPSPSRLPWAVENLRFCPGATSSRRRTSTTAPPAGVAWRRRRPDRAPSRSPCPSRSEPSCSLRLPPARWRSAPAAGRLLRRHRPALHARADPLPRRRRPRRRPGQRGREPDQSTVDDDHRRDPVGVARHGRHGRHRHGTTPAPAPTQPAAPRPARAPAARRRPDPGAARRTGHGDRRHLPRRVRPVLPGQPRGVPRELIAARGSPRGRTSGPRPAGAADP